MKNLDLLGAGCDGDICPSFYARLNFSLVLALLHVNTSVAAPIICIEHICRPDRLLEAATIDYVPG